MIVTCGYQLSFFLFCFTRASLYLVKQAKKKQVSSLVEDQVLSLLTKF